MYYNNINFGPYSDNVDYRQLSGFPGGGIPSFPGFPGLPGSQSGFPGQQPGFPGGQPGFPGQQPGFPGGQQGFPGVPGSAEGAPTTPPPAFTPQLQEGASAFAVDPGGIRRCLYRFTFVWLNNGNSFWFYPIFVGRDSVAGYRWRGFRWVYYGTDLRRIRSFQCF